MIASAAACSFVFAGTPSPNEILSMHRPLLLIAATWLCGALAAPAWSEDAGSTQREDQIKAGYLFNFAKFVEWPASAPGDSLSVCFVGAEGIQSAFEMNLDDKRVGAHRMTVRSVRESDAVDGCHVLYLDGKLPAPLFASFGSSSLPILTVSDAQDFTRNGGIISLYTEKNRLRFIINIQNASRAKLHISSSLLQLASAVEKGDSR